MAKDGSLSTPRTCTRYALSAAARLKTRPSRPGFQWSGFSLKGKKDLKLRLQGAKLLWFLKNTSAAAMEIVRIASAPHKTNRMGVYLKLHLKGWSGLHIKTSIKPNWERMKSVFSQSGFFSCRRMPYNCSRYNRQADLQYLPIRYFDVYKVIAVKDKLRFQRLYF